MTIFYWKFHFELPFSIAMQTFTRGYPAKSHFDSEDGPIFGTILNPQEPSQDGMEEEPWRFFFLGRSIWIDGVFPNHDYQRVRAFQFAQAFRVHLHTWDRVSASVFASKNPLLVGW